MCADRGGDAGPGFPPDPGGMRRGRRQRDVPPRRRKRRASVEARICGARGHLRRAGSRRAVPGDFAGRERILRTLDGCAPAGHVFGVTAGTRGARAAASGQAATSLGLAFSFPWTSSPVSPALMVLAGALGKGLGGVLADRFGWMRTAVCTLTMSIPLPMFGTASHVEKMLAMFLVATTMPVALAAVSESLPREPAFAFGLTGIALLVGALPGFSQVRPLAGMRDPMVAAVLAGSTRTTMG